ncbi:DUF4123 domain-containing protein [Pseudomonas cyclaminis]|uniref:DUF4123 domain-containing protein n=1 Tax=Pseudomonas cyclaminis TaxID=2781239 RepID=UPI0038223F09
MDTLPSQWMSQQLQAGRRLCLILEGENAARQPMLAARGLPEYCSLYTQTPLAEIATAGPLILLLDQVGEPALLNLLQKPETNWGWLGSLPTVDLMGVTQHWRDRLLVGPQGNQALYRFHDNRTLARTLNHLSSEQWPAFLGPLISVCYWHEGRWHCGNNPVPGDYPVPDPVPWLNIPNPNARAILHANILRYLLAEHSESLAALVEFQDPRVWLTQVLEQARAWQWRRPEQLEFLVVRRLEEATRDSGIRWQPTAGEPPEDHFQRVLQQWHRMEKADD